MPATYQNFDALRSATADQAVALRVDPTIDRLFQQIGNAVDQAVRGNARGGRGGAGERAMLLANLIANPAQIVTLLTVELLEAVAEHPQDLRERVCRTLVD